MKRIVFTGGGTGGHIIPNIAIIQEIRKKYSDIDILYIGSKKGPEARLIPELCIEYKSIATGKLRRYFSFKNFIDIFKIPIGIFQAFFILQKFKPNVVFSKGGYVSFPVMVASYIMRIPSVLHESDVSPGLANKLSASMAKVLCLAHNKSKQYFHPKTKKVVTGNPVRNFILQGNPKNAYKLTNFSSTVPTILVMGGSQGASRINTVISRATNHLIKNYQIIHICGKDKIPQTINLPAEFQNRYKSFDYVNKALADFYSITDLVITRAGANTLAEIEAVKIPAILLPLGKKASRGDQLINAAEHQKTHPKSKIIQDEELNANHLIKVIEETLPFESFKKQKTHKEIKNESTTNIITVLDDFFG